MTMTLHELLEGWVENSPAIRVTGIGLDNRKIKPGDAFVAVQGQSVHGMDYAPSAVAAGAVAVIHDGLQIVPELGVPVAEVTGLGNKLGELASRYYAAPSEQMTIAGVTGTNGKTSVAHFLPNHGNGLTEMPAWWVHWATVLLATCKVVPVPHLMRFACSRHLLAA